MYPEDRVLVAYMPHPADLRLAQEEGWYRIPQKFAPKGLHAEYVAFYFGRHFGGQRWAVHYYGRNLGHELVRRIDLLPHEPDHPRAQELYYKVQLGPLVQRPQPIISLNWRRVLFLHTTWDRFTEAIDLHDLVVEGGDYVDRRFATLREEEVVGYEWEETW